MQDASVSWDFFRSPELEHAYALADQVQISRRFAPLLLQAGLQDADQVDRFLHPRLRTLSDPFLLSGMQQAVQRILRAIREKEKIVLYGDYDVDGVTSVAMLARLLRAYGTQPELFLPHRIQEGYGLSAEGVERCLRLHGPRLLIALDCGTSSGERIHAIERTGVDVLVFDHHACVGPVPQCCALVNPKSSEHLSYLCAAGLTFKLCHALLKSERLPDFDLKSFLDLAALGTVADLVPLTGENRILVYFGLSQLAQTQWPGLRALSEVAGLSAPLRAADIAYRLGPRLNAAGRLGTALEALGLLLTDQPAEALALAASLDAQNRERQTVEEQTLQEAIAQLAAFDAAADAAVIVAAGGWHPGVVGIVAARLMRDYHRPALVIGFDEGGLGKGSGRSVPGFSLVRALEACQIHLTAFGGHEMAAGLSLSQAQLGEFAQAFQRHARAEIGDELRQPRLRIAELLQEDDLTYQFLEGLNLFQPFGMGNPQPIFGLQRVMPGGEKVLKDKHRLLTLRGGRRSWKALHFNSVQSALPAPPWDVAFHLESSIYRGLVQLQLHIQGIRTSSPV